MLEKYTQKKEKTDKFIKEHKSQRVMAVNLSLVQRL